MKFFFFIFLSLLLLAACQKENDASKPQVLGDAQTSILIEEFADLECPICATVSPQLEKIVKENPNLGHLEFYHFPLSVHPNAFIAAEGAECAADQGQFWEFSNLIYENQANLNEDYLYKVADSLGLDREDYDQCMEDRKYKEKIQAHMAEGVKRNLTGTPTIFVNEKKVEWTDAEAFESYLKSIKK